MIPTDDPQYRDDGHPMSRYRLKEYYAADAAHHSALAFSHRR